MEPLYRGHIGTLETVLYIEVVLNIQWNLSIEDTVEPLYKGHIRTLYIEVVLNLEVPKVLSGNRMSEVPL